MNKRPGIGTQEPMNKQPGIGTQEPMNKQPGIGTQEPMNKLAMIDRGASLCQRVSQVVWEIQTATV